jgi:branched-chain amino acid transport system ATP-binding protein
MTSLLEIRGLNVFYGGFHAVHGIDLACREGEILSMIGANGAGKSSTLKAIIGQVPKMTGTITFDGRDLTNRATTERVASGIALVPEGRRLFPSLSVEENLRIGAFSGRKGPFDLSAIFDLFPILAERRRQLTSQLSGGQQQMVSIGRALMMNPKLVLFDEISLGLSPKIIGDIYAVLPAIRARGVSMVLVEQDISRSLAIADRFACLLEGRVSLEGRPDAFNRDEIASSYFGAHA